MDRIDQIRAFAAVVANGSFTGAANRLDIAPQLVSKYVKALEENLSVRLLNRTTRSVQLTETGRAFYAKATQLLDDFDELRSSARDEHSAPRGHLRVTAPTTFGELYLVTIIADFLDTFPETTIDLHLTDRHVGLIDEGYDLAIRIGDLKSSSMIARRLADTAIKLIATPVYLANRGTPASPEELGAHRCIIDTNFREPEHWPFTVDGRQQVIRVSGRFRVNSATAARKLALADAGIGLCPSYVVGPDIQSGKLVSLLEAHMTFELGIHAVYLENRHLSGKTRAFIDFVAAALRNDPRL